ncbi:uncharacterized protein PV06_10775 [Exophiala oligosperma]|uniref:L-ascorbate oxidase n=2 Tax=Chaetothyriales TaxID=34395 RepID=A0A0D2A9V8_9EURO|nr:uncharacterized protein PV06_10775 [Exophiala oligosperma]KAJ9640257.1 hypothetical protein H2204_003482 [Knufia peltigerae]KIW37156.1 hypothetical protein PV06_10775 [Exophiala oligosperma]
MARHGSSDHEAYLSDTKQTQRSIERPRGRKWVYMTIGFCLLWVVTGILALNLWLKRPPANFKPETLTIGVKTTAGGQRSDSLVLEPPVATYIPGDSLVKAERFVLDSTWDAEAPATTRNFSLSLEYVISDVDGFNRTMIAINHFFPGPVIECNVNDTVRINVTNNLAEPTSIHWHGIYQRGTPYMDGVTGVSQCPIPVGESMLYEFVVSEEWGTYWYHSHYGSQYNDGAFGAFIVHSSREPYRDQYQGDMIIFLSDWYHTFSNILTAKYLNATGVVYAPVANGIDHEPIRPCNETECFENVSSSNYTQPGLPTSVSEPKPDSVLLNGLNFWNCSSSSGEGCKGGRFTASVDEGKTYRLRLINSGAYVTQMFTVDNHLLQIIEADGNDVDQQSSTLRQGINIAPAQRYSVLINATSPVGNYYMRTRNALNCSFALENFANAPGYTGDALGVLHYAGADNTTAATAGEQYLSTTQDYCLDPDPQELKPYWGPGTLPEAQVTNIVSFGFYQAGASQRIFVNATSWVPLLGDATLLQAQRGLRSGSLVEGGITYNYPPSQFVVTMENATWAQLVINSGSNDAHPFHLHGQYFNVVGTGTGTWNSSIALNTTNPPQRDTAVVPPSGWIAIRWYADNPGLWLLHCHFSWHLSSGLNMQFAQVSSQLAALDIPSPVQSLLEHQCATIRDIYGDGTTVVGIGK